MSNSSALPGPASIEESPGESPFTTSRRPFRKTILALRSWARVPRPEILDQPQQHARAGVGIGHIDMLVGMMADAAPAADEHHGDIGDVDHRHAVMACPARQFEHAKALGGDGGGDLALE